MSDILTPFHYENSHRNSFNSLRTLSQELYLELVAEMIEAYEAIEYPIEMDYIDKIPWIDRQD